MVSYRRFIVLFWGCWAVSMPTWAASVQFRDLSLEAVLLADAADGYLDEFDPVSAALIAGGVVETADLVAARNQILSHFGADLIRDSDEATSVTLFRALHERLLSGKYHVEYTSLHQVLDEGHFNCVSATICYTCLCEQFDIPVTILATREHVFLQLEGGVPTYVETTCPDWFERSAEDREQSLQPAVATARPIDYLQLLGKVFYNRALAELAANRFPDAVELLKVSLELDPDDVPARDNLLAVYNNWALEEAQDGNFEVAASLIEQGRSFDATFAPFAVNDLHIHQQWVFQLCAENRHAEALEVLESAHRRHRKVPFFDEARFAVCREWFESCLSGGRPEQAAKVLNLAAVHFAGDPRWSSRESAGFTQCQDSETDLTSTEL